MSNESMISLSPMDGGDPICIPSEKTVIGRGSLLQITDKRVSRNHATLEICDEKLVIVPIHTNPCFYKPSDSKTSVVLPKDKAKILQHGDVISLLPDKLLYKIVYKNQQDSHNDEAPAVTTGTNAKENRASEEEKKVSKEIPSVPSQKKDLSTQPAKQNDELPCKEVEEEGEDKNRRQLPEWMVGAASRIESNSSKVKNGTESTRKLNKSKASSQVKPKKLDYHDDDDEDDEESIDDDDESADDDDDDDDSFEAKKPGKRSSPQRSKRKPPTRRRYEDDDDDDGAKRRKRMPRAATQKAPKYTDDDFVMSDEEFVIDEEESEQSKGEDSDFVMDDADSGSDWETKGRINKSRGKTPGRKPTGRGRRGRYDSEEASEEDDDDYRPRSTKKRGGGGGRKRKRREGDDDEDEEEDDGDDDYRGSRKKAKRKSILKTKKRVGSSGKKRRRSEDEEEEDENGFDDEEEEEKPKEKKSSQKNKKRKVEEEDHEDFREEEGDKNVKIKKVPSQFGAERHRKNQKHPEDFSHPEKNKEEIEDLNAPRQKRAAALKQKEKLEAMHEASDDEEEEEEEDMVELAA